MPYTIDAANLPKNVKALSDHKKAQWVAIWNSEYAKHNDEGRAFAAANGVAAKSMLEEWQDFIAAKVETSETVEPIVVVKTVVSPDISGEHDNFIKTIIGGVKAFVIGAVTIPVENDQQQKALRFVQTKEGRLRWIAVPSNNFEDRQREVITEAAHKEYIEWADKSGTYPDLWLWHSGPLSKWGRCDWLDYSDGFLVASGLVDAGKEYIAENLAREDTGVSHGFFRAKDGGVITKYRTFEFSPLPAKSAANEWTAFGVEQGKETGVGMAFTKEKRSWLMTTAGMSEPQVAAMETSLSDLAANLKQRGIGYKDLVEMQEAVAAVASIVPPVAVDAKAMDPVAEAAAKKKKAAAAAADPDKDAADDAAEAKTKKEIEGLQGAVKSLGDKFDAFLSVAGPLLTKAAKSDDDRTADMFKAASDSLPKGHQASVATNNVVGDKQQKDDRDWFGMIMDMNSNGTSAGGPKAAGS